MVEVAAPTSGYQRFQNEQTSAPSSSYQNSKYQIFPYLVYRRLNVLHSKMTSFSNVVPRLFSVGCIGEKNQSVRYLKREEKGRFEVGS